MGRRARSGWRKDFLKALARTGNAALSARMAGVDKATAYNLRHRDAGFARAWVRAKQVAAGRVAEERPAPLFANTPPPGRAWSPSPSGDGEALERRRLVLRFSTREGAQMVRAGRGRFSEETRARFREALKETGNVRAAAAAAGISTTAMYKRRKLYPQLEAEWAEAREEACRRVSLRLIEAAEAALDPEVDAEALGLPKVSVADAIAVLRLHRFEEAGAPTCSGARAASRARAQAIEDMPIETVRAEILRRVAAIRAHSAREEEKEEAAVPAANDQRGNSYPSTPSGDGCCAAGSGSRHAPGMPTRLHPPPHAAHGEAE